MITVSAGTTETEEQRALGGGSFRALRLFPTTLGTVTTDLRRGFGTADNEFTTHVFLVMEFIHGALRLFDAGQLDKPKAFGAVGFTMAHDLNVLDGANATEQFLKIAFGGIKREVSDIHTRRRYLDPLGLTALAGRRASRTLGSLGPLGFALGLLVPTDAEKRKETGEKSLFLGGLLFAAGTLLTAT
jgi:hypothetical protein